jgi:hypothetical protein
MDTLRHSEADRSCCNISITRPNSSVDEDFVALAVAVSQARLVLH